ncbi:hypothetical protein [Streptomyces sp. NPDC007000]|uniref:hypothetical protein n=1 Tax=Streptomyces sp. NPDC007000 TaxID=3155357 RepID=UPI0033DD94D7
MSPRGRRAALPDTGQATARGLLPGPGLVVRVFAQDGGRYYDCRFAAFPGPESLRVALAEAFARRTAPGAGVASLHTAQRIYRCVGIFCRYLATLAWPPQQISDLLPEHLDGMLTSRQEKVLGAAEEVGEVRNVLAHAQGLATDLAAKLKEAPPRRKRSSGRKTSYSRQEFRRIVDAARADLRAAAERIRANRELLQRFRDGEEPGAAPDRRLELMDWVDRFGDVPRTPRKSGVWEGSQVPQEWVYGLGKTSEIVSWVHLSGLEAAAGAVLLTALTGENPGVIQEIRASHHRADGHTGAIRTAILSTRKPRRRSRAYMELILSDIPDWITVPADPESLSARDELHTPFGVYALLHELTARSREVSGSDQLLLGWSESGGRGAGRGLRPKGGDGWVRAWAASHDLVADADSAPEPLRVTLSEIRLTYLELHQKPVAHTEKTLATTYLLRNRGNLVEYQKVVAAALEGEVAKARVRGIMAVLTREDLHRAQEDAEAVAAKHGVDPTILTRMISGELDTVMNACVGHTSSPHAPPGEPCRASFMLCLGCPCARALPRHLPIQVLVHDQLEVRRQQLDALQWAERFALAHAQLTDLLGQHDEQDVHDARDGATKADQHLVDRFLNREFDLR